MLLENFITVIEEPGYTDCDSVRLIVTGVFLRTDKPRERFSHLFLRCFRGTGDKLLHSHGRDFIEGSSAFPRDHVRDANNFAQGFCLCGETGKATFSDEDERFIPLPATGMTRQQLCVTDEIAELASDVTEDFSVDTMVAVAVVLLALQDDTLFFLFI